MQVPVMRSQVSAVNQMIYWDQDATLCLQEQGKACVGAPQCMCDTQCNSAARQGGAVSAVQVVGKAQTAAAKTCSSDPKTIA